MTNKSLGGMVSRGPPRGGTILAQPELVDGHFHVPAVLKLEVQHPRSKESVVGHRSECICVIGNGVAQCDDGNIGKRNGGGVIPVAGRRNAREQ